MHFDGLLKNGSLDWLRRVEGGSRDCSGHTMKAHIDCIAPFSNSEKMHLLRRSTGQWDAKKKKLRQMDTTAESNHTSYSVSAGHPPVSCACFSTSFCDRRERQQLTQLHVHWMLGTHCSKTYSWFSCLASLPHWFVFWESLQLKPCWSRYKWSS